MIFSRFFYANDLKLKNFFLGALLCLSLFSCQKEDLSQELVTQPINARVENPSTLIVPKIGSYQNSKGEKLNYLIFPDSISFNQTTQALLQNEIRISWEKQLRFESMKSLYDKIVKQEVKFHRETKKLSTEQAKLLRTYGFVSKLAHENREMIRYDTNYGFDMNISYDLFASVVNKEGIVKVGNILYQYNYESIKKIIDGHPNEFSSLEGFSTNQSSKKVSIYLLIKAHNGGRIEGTGKSSYSLSCDNAVGSPYKNRVVGYEEFTKYYLYPDIRFFINSKCDIYVVVS